MTLTSDDERLNARTCYNYSLLISSSSANISACSIYGVQYALEGLVQLSSASHDGWLPHDHIAVHDAPQYPWRGLMIDSGRRFFPVPLVENLLNTMAAVKLNVLHLHASDFCRWSVESKLYPNLTANLTGVRAGHYTQADVRHLVAYAADRAVRIVPEFDMPGHSRSLLPLEGNDAIHFCTDASNRSQLYDDPGLKTYSTVHALMKEMASLFPDDVFHIGCDETKVTGRCALNSTFDFERRLATAVEGDFGKVVEGWEELLFDAGAATTSAIVNAWASHRPPEITKTGRQAVESWADHFYFTDPAPGGPAGWARCWYDIASGVPSREAHLLLGGEMSMWSDTYCHTAQCGARTNHPDAPVGAALFAPSQDAEFAESIGGMSNERGLLQPVTRLSPPTRLPFSAGLMHVPSCADAVWPRGYVGAAAFWNWNASADPHSVAFERAIWRLNDQLIRRGSKSCPSHCSCNQLTACGNPYIPPAA